MIIVYFILMSHGWQFEAIDNEPVSPYYCEWLKKDLASKEQGKIGNMKVICLEDDGVDL